MSKDGKSNKKWDDEKLTRFLSANAPQVPSIDPDFEREMIDKIEGKRSRIYWEFSLGFVALSLLLFFAAKPYFAQLKEKNNQQMITEVGEGNTLLVNKDFEDDILWETVNYASGTFAYEEGEFLDYSYDFLQEEDFFSE